MNKHDLSRRRFIQGSLASALLYGSGTLPVFQKTAYGMPSSIQNRVLVDLFLRGGPDFRHLVAPAFDSNPANIGARYWANRQRAHNLNADGIQALQRTEQSRWEEDFYHITVGDTSNGWASGLVDAGNLNSGVTFGIWKEAGWLIKMFRQGNVALIFNAVGGTNRAHDLSELMAYQGDLSISLSDSSRSGWGGRLARAAGGRAIAATNSPSPFAFGPIGQPFTAGYNPNAIDNSQLLAIGNSREFGLFEGVLDGYPFGDYDDNMARAAKGYYGALRQENLGSTYEKFLDHEFNTRTFGNEIQQRLSEIDVPPLIESLQYGGANGVNPGLDNNGNFQADRHTIHRTEFGRQIRNTYDVLALNDLSVNINGTTVGLNPRVLSLDYVGWDTHADQRRVHPDLVNDPHDPYVSRGIENGLKDIFGGPSSEVDANQPHSGYSALWESLNGLNRSNVAFTVYGEFGRQIRDNGGNGTDHGSGNLMMVIGENVRGGVYGQLFQDDEVAKYDEEPNRTPDITPRSEIDSFFSEVCDWVSPNSGSLVFPRTASGFNGQAPLEEINGMFDNLFI